MTTPVRPNQWNYRVSPAFEAAALDFYPHFSPHLVNYLIHCSETHAFVYISTPKVASSTVQRMVQLVVVDGEQERLASMGGHIHKRSHSPIPPLTHSGISLVDALEGDRYFRFAFVRNPFTRALSAYLDKVKRADASRAARLGLGTPGDLRFIDYLRALEHRGRLTASTHWIPQCSILIPNRVRYDFMGRFERFAADLATVAARIAPHLSSLRSVRVDQHRTASSAFVSELIGPRERDIILRLYADDFEAFGYSRDPAQALA